MDSINRQEFTEEAAYQVHAVLETISRLGKRVEVYDGERLVGVILRGELLADDDRTSDRQSLDIEESLQRHHQRLKQYEADRRPAEEAQNQKVA